MTECFAKGKAGQTWRIALRELNPPRDQICQRKQVRLDVEIYQHGGIER
jgi:hypothetical protein